tara:strand:- start:451 stop:720 length:270 start_codon:yes stop_codon:yes gene_type:complete
MIGLSISLCVAAILKGEIAEVDVEQIIGRTAARTEEDWQGVIASYREKHWSQNPDAGEAILRHLLRVGKIQQPRLEGKEAPSIADGIWR